MDGPGGTGTLGGIAGGSRPGLGTKRDGMPTQDNPPDGKGDGQLSDTWWATVAVRALHPIQVQIVEALRWIGEPLAASDLGEIVEDVEWVRLNHHIRRLNKLRAIMHAEAPNPANVMNLRYRLATAQQSDER